MHLKDGSYTLFNAAERKAEAAAAAGTAAAADGPRLKAVAVQRALQTLEMEVSQIMKGGFDHYMQASRIAGMASWGVFSWDMRQVEVAGLTTCRRVRLWVPQ